MVEAGKRARATFSREGERTVEGEDVRAGGEWTTSIYVADVGHGPCSLPI